MTDIDLKQLFINIAKNTTDSNAFEYYDELERGIRLEDSSNTTSAKIILEFSDKKYYISFNYTIKKEISKTEFFDLQKIWENGKTSALSSEYNKRKQKDLLKLKEISEKYI